MKIIPIEDGNMMIIVAIQFGESGGTLKDPLKVLPPVVAKWASFATSETWQRSQYDLEIPV